MGVCWWWRQDKDGTQLGTCDMRARLTCADTTSMAGGPLVPSSRAVLSAANQSITGKHAAPEGQVGRRAARSSKRQGSTDSDGQHITTTTTPLSLS
jgi:hypothetical protein